MAAGMSLSKLNELLERALRGLHQEGLSIVTYQEPKPWLPESYWAEQASIEEAVGRVMDLAEHAREVKAIRARADASLAAQSATDVMAEWDTKLPTMQGPDERMARAGWGRDSMHSYRPPSPPTPGNQQPEYNNLCQFCFRPITTRDEERWKDHGGKVHCESSTTPYGWHLPEGEDPLDDWDEDDA